MRARARAGFTVLEIVLAMSILLIGMASILGLLSFGAAMSRTAELRSETSQAVEAVVADLQASLFPIVEQDGLEVAGEPRTIEDQPVPGHPGLVYSATPRGHEPARSPGAPLEYRVDVEIAWSTAGTRRSRTFSTLFTREVPFGERLRRRLVEADR